MDVLTDNQLKCEIKQFCCQLWSLSEMSLTMPCSNPCSLMRKDIARLNTKQYWVGEKTDGVRMFLLLGVYDDTNGEEKTYSVLINRAFQIYTIVIDVPDDYYTGSLFDGELVTTESGQFIYTPFDTIVSTGFSMVNYAHSERMAVTRRAFDVIRFITPPMQITVKQWYPIEHAVAVFEKAVHCDGLIFVPENGPLVNGTQFDTFKWKKSTKHTIDFVLHSSGMLFVMDRGMTTSATELLNIVLANTDHAKTFVPVDSPIIVECECAKIEVTWVATPLRVREDKERANSVNAARATLQNITENVELIEIIRS